ncbi:MAG: helix-turn-helix domain-containing protein [Thermodesulfovibrionia bacterium]|nr:helix-turn-helix domain-containing protein [Thermodesulfovibrionia bacterium]
MKTELEQEDLAAIASALFEMLKPFLHTPQQQEDEILSVEEVSKLIGKKKDQIYQWVNNSKHGLGVFPYMKAGRSLRFSKNAVMQWMKNNGKPLEIG